MLPKSPWQDKAPEKRNGTDIIMQFTYLSIQQPKLLLLRLNVLNRNIAHLLC